MTLQGYQYSQGRSRILSAVYPAPALGTATAVHAAFAAAAPQVITTGITNPGVARNVTATPGGTTGNVLAVAVTVVGTNVYGEPLTEVLPAFTAGQATAVTGSKAFATVTSISVPAAGTAVTVSVGTGAKLGLPVKLSRNTVVAAYLANVKETTAPTVAFNATSHASNTVTLNSALNGSDVIVDYYAG